MGPTPFITLIQSNTGRWQAIPDARLQAIDMTNGLLIFEMGYTKVKDKHDYGTLRELVASGEDIFVEWMPTDSGPYDPTGYQ